MINLGITESQQKYMVKRVVDLRRLIDAIGETKVRRDIDDRLCDVLLLLRDGNLKGKNGGNNAK